MRASRRFVLTSMAALEGRLVLSAVIHTTGGHVVEFRAERLPQAEIAQSNASDVPFGFGPSETLQSGSSVAEQLTTRYSDGSTQTESLLKVPDLAKNTVTSYETIKLRNNGGTEKVVDTESFSGGVAPLSGNDNTHNLTITLPNGSTETQTYSEVITGHRTVVNGTTHEASGGIETWTAVKINTGQMTTTNRTITEPNGSIEHQRSVTRVQGDLDSTSETLTMIPDKAAILRSSSATNVIRVQPPSS
jgi:hypothetical protein